MRELGDFLYQERQKKGITLEELEQITKIRIKYLRAIEEGDFEVIPGEVYLKGFLKSYAEAVGVPGENVLTWYEQLKGPTVVEDETSYGQSAASQDASIRELKIAKPSFGRAILTALLLVILAFIGYRLWEYYRPTPAEPNLPSSGVWQEEGPGSDVDALAPPADTAVVPPEPGTNPAVGVEQEERELEEEMSEEPAQLPEEPVDATPPQAGEQEDVGAEEDLAGVQAVAPSLVLEVSAEDSCWLELYVDGQRAYYDLLPIGEIRMFQGTEIYAKFGRGDVVTLRVNGMDLGTAGAGVVRWHFTAEESKVVPAGTGPL